MYFLFEFEIREKKNHPFWTQKSQFFGNKYGLRPKLQQYAKVGNGFLVYSIYFILAFKKKNGAHSVMIMFIYR